MGSGFSDGGERGEMCIRDRSLTYMEDFGVDLMDIPQSARSLSDATVDLQLKVRSKKLRHNQNNGLMTWSFANALVTSNSFGEIKVDKKDNKRGRRIDPIDACLLYTSRCV